MNRPSTGFTLLELLIVVIIIGILASIALPNFSKAVEKTKVQDAENTLAAVYSAEKVYRLDQGSYGHLLDLVNNNYITNPNTGNTTWIYAYTGAGDISTTFTVTAERTGGDYSGDTLTVDQNFDGTNNGYGGTHPLK